MGNGLLPAGVLGPPQGHTAPRMAALSQPGGHWGPTLESGGDSCKMGPRLLVPHNCKGAVWGFRLGFKVEVRGVFRLELASVISVNVLTEMEVQRRPYER